MQKDEAHRIYADWITMQRRGRQRIQKASKDPVTRARLLADIPSPGPVIFRPRYDDIGPAVSSLPAYCTPPITPVCRSPPRNSHGFSFLGSFPPEIRNAIYQYVIDYPTCRELFDAYYTQVDTFKARSQNTTSCGFTVSLYTPTILLLCKQITREALTVLRLRPFVVDRIPPWVMGDSQPLPLTHLISKSTLQNVRFMEMKLSLGDCEKHTSGKIWSQVLLDILGAWAETNSLIRLKVMIKVNNIDVERLWDRELKVYTKIVRAVDTFAFQHGSKPDLVQYEHWVIDCNYAYKCGFRIPLIRKHPDPYIWQGSVMEWICAE
ncbi:hypothetical protein HD806DRAFT_518918 [Xylariaceae sp. AK1471]|nr:hypothetical protein HD806DRAFT_518918 [Xylariaceae sp. AK1471]